MTKSNRDIPNAEEGFSLISNQKLLILYNTMLCCRGIALEASSDRKSAGGLLGHEAAVVGAAIDLLPQDTVVHTFSPHAALAAVNSNVSASPDMKQAVRSAAWSKGGQISVVFAGSKQVVQQAWHKGLALAADRKLPVLFVALGARGSLDAEAGELRIPQAETMPSLPRINVDGNDVVAVYRVATEAITHARKGHGPALIECRRSAPDDPIENMRKYLIGKGINPTPWPGAVASIPPPPRAPSRKPAQEAAGLGPVLGVIK
jgi:TPP-dependent pyruvate/acetoin dehydrogenase alpha subunit